MDNIRETYELETLEQLRAVADVLRVRILNQLSQQAMTVTQLAELLDVAPSKLHYHVHELEKVKLLKLVDTREKGGILEKYYRSVAKMVNAPGTLFQGMPPDEVASMLTEVIQPFLQGFIQTAQHMVRAQIWDNPDQVVQLSPEHYWMTADEFRQVNKQIETILQPYKERRGIEREREQAMLLVGYTVAPSATSEEETPPQPKPEAAAAKVPKREFTLVAGVMALKRKDLEKALAAGTMLDLHLLGACTFADDVTPDLVEQAIGGFHLWGKLIASPEVREVLKRKGGESGQKTSSSA